MTAERHALTVRLPKELREWLRTAAFEERVSQQALIEGAVILLRSRWERGIPALVTSDSDDVRESTHGRTG